MVLLGAEASGINLQKRYYTNQIFQGDQQILNLFQCQLISAKDNPGMLRECNCKTGKLDKDEEFKLEKSEIRKFWSCSRKTTIKGFVVATCSSNQDNASKCWTFACIVLIPGTSCNNKAFYGGFSRAAPKVSYLRFLKFKLFVFVKFYFFPALQLHSVSQHSTHSTFIFPRN